MDRTRLRTLGKGDGHVRGGVVAVNPSYDRKLGTWEKSGGGAYARGQAGLGAL